MPGQYLYVLERDDEPLAAYADSFTADEHYERALCEGEDVALYRYGDIDQMLQTLDRLQFKAEKFGDDAEWERLAAIRTEVMCERARDSR